MKESDFSKFLIGRLPGHLQRIETSVSSGVPDLNWCNEGLEAWLELKVTRAGRTRLRPLQYSWGMRRTVAGGRVVVVSRQANDTLHVHRFPLTIDDSLLETIRIISPPDAVIPINDRMVIALIGAVFTI